MTLTDDQFRAKWCLEVTQMTYEQFRASWAVGPQDWEGRRVSYTGGTKFRNDDPPDGYSGEGVVTDEIPVPSGVVLNVRCDTHGPITCLGDDCAVVVREVKG